MDKIMRLFKRVSGREIDQKLSQLREHLDQQIDVINRTLGEIDEKIENQSNSLKRRLEELAKDLSQNAIAGSLLGERTYNLVHADHEQKLVRTFLGNIFNRDKPCNNPAFIELLKLADGDEVADSAWESILAEA